MNRNSFAKRWIALIVAIVAALVVLAACSSTPTPTPTTAPTKPVSPTTTTTAPITTSPAPPPTSPASTTTATPAPTTATPSTTAPAYTVKTASMTGMGDYLVDGKGMTLYYFAKDSVGKSTATAAILQNWPVFNPASFIVPSTLNAADFGTITRDDGGKQATYK